MFCSDEGACVRFGVVDSLSNNALGNGFDSALFQISLNGLVIDTQSFTDLASAEAFFSNNLIGVPLLPGPNTPWGCAYPVRTSFSGIRVVRSNRINGQVSDPRITGIRPIFVAALAAAMLPTCSQSCDSLSSGEQFSITADLFAHPMSIYWRDRLFSKTHSLLLPACSPIATRQRTSCRAAPRSCSRSHS
jgi:hypothetical protein